MCQGQNILYEWKGLVRRNTGSHMKVLSPYIYICPCLQVMSKVKVVVYGRPRKEPHINFNHYQGYIGEGGTFKSGGTSGFVPLPPLLGVCISRSMYWIPLSLYWIPLSLYWIPTLFRPISPLFAILYCQIIPCTVKVQDGMLTLALYQ